jgi:hypothetical protein
VRPIGGLLTDRFLSEFVPAHGRGRRVSSMLVFWYGAYLVSVVAAYGLPEGLGWSGRATLATSAIPALVVLGLRIGLPESPRWLMRSSRSSTPSADRPYHETMIYEAHVRGLTMRHPGVPEELRGTDAGLIHPAVIDHLLRSGVTAVELMPVQHYSTTIT